jgi:uncharacterized protein (DUF1330 family)
MEYGKLAYPTLVATGGKMLAASSQSEVIEGEWQPGVLVIIEFATAEKARQWINSPRRKRRIDRVPTRFPPNIRARG